MEIIGNIICLSFIINLFMHQIFPKVNKVFSYHLQNFEVINSLMQSILLRVDAEEQYEKAINKSAFKISQLTSQHPLYSKIILSFKSLISERAHQIRQFKHQLAKQAEVLKEALNPLEQQMREHLSELRNMEKDLKSSFDTLIKDKNYSEQRIKELDEKFILNQVAVLYKQNLGLRKNSEGLLVEQENMIKTLEKDWEGLKVEMGKFEAGAQEREKKIWELDVKVQEEFVDFIKKLNVHEISLIRNIQYDIDTMIKKTDIFNWQNTNEFKDQFSMKTMEQLQLSFTDPYFNFKKAMISQHELIDPQSKQKLDEQKLTKMKSLLQQGKQSQQMLSVIVKNYAFYRDEICQWIQSFRKSGVFKFDLHDFNLIVSAFRQFLRTAISILDFECVQKIILFGNSYFHLGQNNKRKTVLEKLKKEKILGDLVFWKFYLLWGIRQNVGSCKALEERQIYLRNGVYSTLLSNALTMVDFGIEKHSIKNLVGKIAKTFGSLTEAQVAELLKVIQTAYQNNQKVKKRKKQQSKKQ